MTRDDLVSILFFGGLAYWAYISWRNKKRAKTSSLTEATPVRTPDAAPAESENADPFLARIIEERKKADHEVKATLDEYKTEMEVRFAQDLKLKERLAAFAKKQGLDHAMHELYEAIKHFPAWCKRDDWANYNVFGLEGPVTEKNKDAANKAITFYYKGQRYDLAIREWSGMEGEPYMDFHLFEDGEEMFSVNCGADYSDWGRQYRPFSIDAFRKKGNWAVMLLEFQKLKRIESEETSVGLKYFKAGEIKEKFEE